MSSDCDRDSTTSPPLKSSPDCNSGRENYTTSTTDDGFRIKVRELTAGLHPDLIGKKRRTGYNNAAGPLKRHAMGWAKGFPGKWSMDEWENSTLTRAERAILAAVIWRCDITKGYAAMSYEQLGDAAANLYHRKGEPNADAYNRDTVYTGVKKMVHLGLIQIKSGQGGVQDRRSLANQYTPNFWMFLDPFSGQFVSPEYGLDYYEWRTIANYFRARVENGETPPNPTAPPKESGASGDISDNPATNGVQEPAESAENTENPTALPKESKASGTIRKNPTALLAETPQESSGAQSESGTLYANAGSGDANASPATPDGSRSRDALPLSVPGEVHTTIHFTIENLAKFSVVPVEDFPGWLADPWSNVSVLNSMVPACSREIRRFIPGHYMDATAADPEKYPPEIWLEINANTADVEVWGTAEKITPETVVELIIKLTSEGKKEVQQDFRAFMHRRYPDDEEFK